MRKIFKALALNFALVATACATVPSQRLEALLTSQGINAPWLIEQEMLNSGNSWLVTVREARRQIGPGICSTHRRVFEVTQRLASFEIQDLQYTDSSWRPVQEIALADCVNARPEDLRQLTSYQGDLADEDLRRVIATLSELRRLAADERFEAKFHYDRESLRAALLTLNPKSLTHIDINSPESVIAHFNIGEIETLWVGLGYEDGILRDVYVSTTLFVNAR